MSNHIIKGAIAFAIGLIFFLHTLGIMQQSLSTLIIIGSVLIMVYGLVELNAYSRFQAFMKRIGKR